MSLSIETPKTINFPFVPNWKLIAVGVPIFKHLRVYSEALKLLKFLEYMEYSFQVSKFLDFDGIFDFQSQISHILNLLDHSNPCKWG